MAMKSKVLIASGLLAAFLIGALAGGYIKPGLSNALNSTPSITSVGKRPASGVQRYVQTEEVRPVVRHRRSWEREVLIVAGSSGAGTAIGALAGGKKGAGIGALSGGIAGLVYDLATRNK